jgi:hypothetical protein
MGAPYDIDDTIRLGAPYDIDATVRLGAPYDIGDYHDTYCDILYTFVCVAIFFS